MAVLSATFAAAFAQYSAALAAQNAYYEAHVAPADKAYQAAQDAAGRVRDTSAPDPALDATYEAYDAAQAHFDELVDVTNTAAEKLMLLSPWSIAELACKIDVAAEQEMLTHHTRAAIFVEAIRADAHALAGE